MKLMDANVKWKDAYTDMFFIPYDHDLRHDYPLCWACYRRFYRICKAADLSFESGECRHRKWSRTLLYHKCIKRCAKIRRSFAKAAEDRRQQLCQQRR